MSTVFCPSYYYIIKRQDGKWFKGGSLLTSNVSRGLTGIEEFGITKRVLLLELKYINGGQPGFYIANVKDKQYYYCQDWSEVKKTFVSLGIGREEKQI